MKLTTQLVSFITLCVIAAITLVLVGGVFSFRELGMELQQKKVNSLAEVIGKQLEAPQGIEEMNRWLPTLLRAAHVVELEVRQGKRTLYLFRDVPAELDKPLLLPYRLTLPNHDGVSADFKLERPFKDAEYSLNAMSGISLGVFIAIFGLCYSIRWLRQQLRGAELLGVRAQLILDDKLSKLNHDSADEWPVAASQALDYLLAELADARKERSRFDNFIRSNAFVDKTTGIGNRLFFDNRLENAIIEASVMNGGILLIDLAGLEVLDSEQFDRISPELLQEASATIGAFVRKHSGALQARYAGQVFAVLLPNMSESEMVDGASQLLKSLQRLHWPPAANPETAVYLGAVCYQTQDSLLKVQEEAELALKSARLQGHNGWFLYEKQLDEESIGKGSVRWRALISRHIEQRSVAFYIQSIQQDRDHVVLQQELITYLHDEQGRMLQAGVFMPMAEKVGLLLPLDRLIAAQTLQLLGQRTEQSCPISLSINVQSLLDTEFQRWLFFTLFQLPRSTNERLVLQLSESQVTRHYEALKRPLRSLRMLGCLLAVDHAGQDVVSTQYIKEFEINFLKLHPSLVREIHARQVNQMAVRSLVGGCANTPTRVLAVGVESGNEWKMLRHLGVHAGQGPWFAAPESVEMTPVE
ncbi:EAL domain-containing protein [Aeromonas cavernicola]|uniref:RNase E specificity factor CsrD n=1 Tax=Aeromonas cavernicola TaxID=1006623 RepID=A0A2H9U293_9GAMM|nr:EAL domain-containing protein [Aeromonas cavernicola]PJG58172.1 RNase E specificity factor CsrD [Aeromonas cavernicola]